MTAQGDTEDIQTLFTERCKAANRPEPILSGKSEAG